MIISLFSTNENGEQKVVDLINVEDMTFCHTGDIKVYFKSGSTLWVEKEEYEFFGVYTI